MPQAAATLERESFHRILILAAPKAGKTTTITIALAEAYGNGYVIECGDKSSLLTASKFTLKFKYDIVRTENSMEACLKDAREGVKTGQFAWIFVDDFTLYASYLEGDLCDRSRNSKGEPDGRRYWPEYRQRLNNIVGRLFDIKAHIVFSGHYIEAPQLIDGQREKTGVGIMPMLAGAAREEIPARFHDVIFMEKRKPKKEEGPSQRIWMINPSGVWGPGSRSVDGTLEIDASFKAFDKAIAESDRKRH
jgi:hypothetical protein